MRPVNLIPPEERRGDRAPLRAGAFSYAIVGLLAVALLGVVVLVMTGNKITEKEGELATLEARQAAAEQRVQELAPYGEFATLSQSRRETISSLAKSRFDWERVLNELALVIPEDVWLESLTGAVAPGISTGDGGGEAATDSSIAGPSLQITGCADGQVAVARFLASLRDIDGVTRVGMKNSSLGATDGEASAAAEPSGDTASIGGCQTRDFIAAFEIAVAFDAVPAPAVTTAPSAPAAPAAGTATPEQQAAEASAAEQSSQAQEGAETVGVGG